MSEEDKKGFMHTLDRLWRTAKNPYDIVKGTAEFVSAIPGFVAGLGTGIVNIPLEVGRRIAKDESFTIEDLYNAAEGPFSEVMEMWHRGVSGPLGQLLEMPRAGGQLLAEKMTGALHKDYEKGDPELVGEMFMAPYTAVSGPLHSLANSETYKDYPNARGVIKFAADALGLITMGRVMKGGKEEFVAKAEPIVNKAAEIDKIQNDLKQIPDSVFKDAQQKVLDMKKQQLELEAKAIEESLDYPKMIKEDLEAKRKTIDRIKKKDVTKNVDEAIDAAYNKATEQSIIERHFGKKEDILKEAEKRKKKVRSKIKRTKKVSDEVIAEEMVKVEQVKPSWEMSRKDIAESLISKDVHPDIKANNVAEANALLSTGKPRIDSHLFLHPEEVSKAWDKVSKEFPDVAESIRSITEAGEKMGNLADTGSGLEIRIGSGYAKNYSVKGGLSRFYETAIRHELLHAQAIKNKYEKYGVETDPRLHEVIDNIARGEITPHPDYPNLHTTKPILTTQDISNFYEKELGYAKKDAIDIAKFDVEDVIPLYEKSTRKKVETIDNYKEMLDYYENIKEETKEIDYQLGERKPVELEQERHPLRETDTETVNARAKVYEEKIKGVMEDPELFTGKLVNDVNRWLNGDESVPIEQVRNGLRELAVRADELRYDFFADSPDYPSSFLNWKELVTEASEWAGKADRSKIKRTEGPSETTLFDITQVPAEAFKLLKGMSTKGVEAVREFRKTESLKKFDLGYAAKQLKIDTYRGLIDQSEPLLKQVRKLYPKEAQKIIDRQRSVVAGKGYGRIQYDLLDKEVYSGKSNAQVEAINFYILARRFNDIYGYKAGSKYKHVSAYGPDQMSNLSAIIEMVKSLPAGALKAAKTSIPELKEIFGNLTPKEISEVIESGNRYFEWMRKVVDDVVEAGLKTPKEGELLKAHDFRKFKTLKVEQLYDFNYDVKLKGETIRSTYSGVESLGRGSLKIIDTDPRPVTSEMFARIYGAIANQAAKKEWKALAEKHPENGIVSEKHILGWSSMPYMENGVRKNLYFNPVATKYLITQSHDLSHRLTKVIRGFMLAPVTRALAVGTSPAWATFVGLPMDVTHSIFTAKIFDPVTGKPKKLYSPFLPHAGMQIGMDMVRTLGDIYTRGEFFKDYMKHGGVMPFLTMRENRYMRGVRPPGDWAKFIDLISYHGASMETWVRAATADRAIRKVAKREGVSYEEARKNKDVMYEAVHAARDRMDYNQGGWFVKALDQLGFIFLNAGMLGTRTFWRSAKENPVDFTLKTAQIGVTATGIATVGWMLYPHVMKDIPEEGNEKNLIVPLFPNHVSAIDENGDEVYFYAKLRLDPGAAFMYKVFDGLTRTYLYDKGLIDQEPDYKKLVSNLKTIGPYGLSLPPAAQMASEYWSNYSWWKDRRMYTDMGGRTLDWPKSAKEGIYDEEGVARDPRLSQLSVDVSKVTGLSPIRGQEAIGNVIPRNNEFVMLMSGAYDWAFSDVPKELKSKHWLLTLADMPGINRIIGVTRPGYNVRSAGDEPIEEARLESIVRNGKMDFLAENYYWKGYGSEGEIDKYIDSFENEPHVMDSLENKRKFVENVKDIPNRSAWVSMFHTTPEAKAKHFFKLYGSMSSESDKVLDSLMDAKYLSNDGYIRFMDEMDKLSNEKVR
jgi:hypothetical protein